MTIDAFVAVLLEMLDTPEKVGVRVNVLPCSSLTVSLSPNAAFLSDGNPGISFSGGPVEIRRARVPTRPVSGQRG